jgi:ankyrin repeat protein
MVDSWNQNGWTSLHLAANQGHLPMVKVLLGFKGINLDMQDNVRSVLFAPVHVHKQVTCSTHMPRGLVANSASIVTNTDHKHAIGTATT